VLGDINAKLQALRECHIEPREARIERSLEEEQPNGDHVQALLRELLCLEKEAKRLEVERELNARIEHLTDDLEKLADRIDELEESGLNDREREEITAHIDEIEESVLEVERSMTVWIMMRRYTMVESGDDSDTPTEVRARVREYADRVAEGIEQATGQIDQVAEKTGESHITMLGGIPIGLKEKLEVSRKLDSIVNRHGFADLDRGFDDIDVRDEFTRTVREWNKKAWLLGDKVERIRQELRSGNEQRLDDLVRDFHDWVYTGLKETTPEWKYPQVKLVEYAGAGPDLALDFYVDNITLDHFERQERVEADLRREIWERFREAGIEMPLPQMDIHLRNRVPPPASRHATAPAAAARAAPTPRG
jgi:hypothetical protein